MVANYFRVLLLGLLSGLFEIRAVAASIRPSFSSGLMVPPASQYYHFVYGAQLDVAQDLDRSLVRLQYLQRPKFSSRGYSDQDFSGLFLIGQSILRWRTLGVTSLIGGGYAWGYIKSDTEGSKAERYKLPGLAVALEGRWTPKYLDLRFSHQVLIAHSSNEQLTAYVAWPFNWFVISLSRPIEL